MRKVTVLLTILLVLAVACDKNDENTVNSIPKSHLTFPVFHMSVDNNYQTFGVDSVQLTIDPAIGWLESVYTDANGYIGTQDAGTYITSIDTTIIDADTTVDTSSVIFGFSPSQQYKFSFARAESYSWLDTFKIEYSQIIDSLWMVLNVDTQLVLQTPISVDPAFSNPDEVRVVYTAFDTLLNIGFDSSVIQYRLQVVWDEDTVHVLDPTDTLLLPPDEVYMDTAYYLFYSTEDSLYLPIDSQAYCDIAIDTVIDGTDTTFNDFFIEIRVEQPAELGGPEFPITIIDTVTRFTNCTGDITSQQTKIYNTWGWGNFDTIPLSTILDTMKELSFTGSALTIRNTVTDVTTPATVYFIQDGVSTTVDSLVFDLTMPDVEVYPDYEIIIKDE